MSKIENITSYGSISQDVYNLDEFMRSIDDKKVILNDLDVVSERKEDVLNMIFTTQDSTHLDARPRCNCGYTVNSEMIGKTCPKCFSLVKDITEKRDPVLWIKKIVKEQFLSPAFYNMMSSVFVKKVDVIRWLASSKYNPTNVPQYVLNIPSVIPGYKRNYQTFINNIEPILEYFMAVPELKKQRNNINEILHFYMLNKHILYSDFLPVINNRVFVMERDDLGSYTNTKITDVVDLVYNFNVTINGKRALTDAARDEATIKVISGLAKSYYTIIDEILLKKEGGFRKHVYGTRSHFTFRCVISSIAGPHDYNEIHTPWSIGVTAFRLHLLNLLVNRFGMFPKEAFQLLASHVNKYEHRIAECLDLLIKESRGKGIEVTICRNPSLLRGSIQKVFITKFKKDPNDNTIGISIFICPPMNADFDGDEENVSISLDNKMADAMNVYDLSYSVPDLSEPFAISGNINLPDPAVEQLVNWVHVDRDPKDNKIDFFSR